MTYENSFSVEGYQHQYPEINDINDSPSPDVLPVPEQYGNGDASHVTETPMSRDSDPEAGLVSVCEVVHEPTISFITGTTSRPPPVITSDNSKKNIEAVLTRVVSYLKSNFAEEFVDFRTEENSIQTVYDNLLVHYTPCTEQWNHPNLMPQKTSFDSLEEGICHCMMHAAKQNYQLVPRFDTSGTLELCCDRMCADDIDKENVVYQKNLAEEYPIDEEEEEEEEEEDFDKSVRKKCGFKMILKHVDEKYLLEMINHDHNHFPSVHPVAHIGACEEFHCYLNTTKWTGNFTMHEEMLRKGVLGLFFPETLIKHVTKVVNDRKKTRLEDKTPTEALTQLLHTHPLRGAFTEQCTFFAHTQGYRYWKAYPEVVYITFKGHYKPRNCSSLHLLQFQGLDPNNRLFPICYSLSEKWSEQNRKWALEQYKELLDDFNLPYPGYIHTDADVEFVQILRQVFPDTYVHIDKAKHLSAAHLNSTRQIKQSKTRAKAISLWMDYATAEDEETMLEKLQEGNSSKSEGLRKFFSYMTKYQCKGSTQALSNQKLHFLARQKKIKATKVPNALNIFEIVRSILLDVVERYYDLEREHAKCLAESKSGFDEFFARVEHLISYKVLEKVKEERQNCDGECKCHTSGYPCGHVIAKIEDENRVLHVDDFHPHWRNLFADIYSYIPKGGGRFTELWGGLKTGNGVLDAFDGSERASKRQRVE